jgi:hypothetical protein
MQYDVRYQIGGEEHSQVIDADSAADAARLVQDQFLQNQEMFELIQVHLLEEEPESPAATSDN